MIGCQYRIVPKYTAQQRTEIKNIVASLTIKRIPDSEIIKEVFDETKKSSATKTDQME